MRLNYNYNQWDCCATIQASFFKMGYSYCLITTILMSFALTGFSTERNINSAEELSSNEPTRLACDLNVNIEVEDNVCARVSTTLAATVSGAASCTTNSCDLSEGQLIAHWNMNECRAFISDNSSRDFSELIATSNSITCASVTTRGIYTSAGMKHSCTDDASTGSKGDAVCVGMPNISSFQNNHPNAVKFDVTIDPSCGVNGITKLEFQQLAPNEYTWSAGGQVSDTGKNNYPEKYGIRILKNGLEIYRQTDISTTNFWNLETFDFVGNTNFQSAVTCTYTFELLGYSLVGNDATVAVWDLDNIKIYGGTCTSTSGSTTNSVTYSWSTGASTPTISVDEPGTYYVTVTDCNACTATSQAVVERPNVSGGRIVVGTCSNGTIVIESESAPSVPEGQEYEVVWMKSEGEYSACEKLGELGAGVTNVGAAYAAFVEAGGFEAGADPSIPNTTNWKFVTDADGDDLQLTVMDSPMACYLRCIRMVGCKRFIGESDPVALPDCFKACSDMDGDGICDDVDNCLNIANPDQLDTNNNGVGDVCEPQACICPAVVIPVCGVDGKTYNNSCEADCAGVAWTTGECAGITPPDPCETAGGDRDGDGICDDFDNCLDMANADQIDTNDDGIGDACEAIIPPSVVICDVSVTQSGTTLLFDNIDITAAILVIDSSDWQTVFSCAPWATSCRGSFRVDGLIAGRTYTVKIEAYNPNCIFNENITITGVSMPPMPPTNPCDIYGDMDGDGICDNIDNCPSTANANQTDTNRNNIGDACETSMPLTCDLLSGIDLNLCGQCIRKIAIYEYQGANYLVKFGDNVNCADVPTSVTNCANATLFCIDGSIVDDGTMGCTTFFSEAVEVEVVAVKDPNCGITSADPIASGEDTHKGTAPESCGISFRQDSTIITFDGAEKGTVVIFDKTTWQEAFKCFPWEGTCENNFTVTLEPGKSYKIKLETYNPSCTYMTDITIPRNFVETSRGSNSRSNIANTVTDIAASTNKEISVYPNPAFDMFHIALGKYAGQKGQINLLNSIGQNIVQLSIDEIDAAPVQVDLNRIAKGFYYLQIMVDGKLTKVQKVVVE